MRTASPRLVLNNLFTCACYSGAAAADLRFASVRFEVARRVRRLVEPVRPLLVALTGYGQPETRAHAEAAGFDLYLVKPVDPADLSELVLSWTVQN